MSQASDGYEADALSYMKQAEKYAAGGSTGAAQVYAAMAHTCALLALVHKDDDTPPPVTAFE